MDNKIYCRKRKTHIYRKGKKYMSENQVADVMSMLNYKNSAERDQVKKFFTNPSQINKERKTIVWSTPLT